MWVGGKLQWRPGECESREGNNRPWMSINRCKPAVDQVENEARNNPPGPEAYPVGGTTSDSDGSDILEGLIREYEYRSDAKTAYLLGLRYAAAGGRGVFEMGTEYAGARTLEQQIIIKSAPDPAVFFYDPNAVLPNREDSMWGGKIRRLTRQQLIEEYGTKLKVLNRSAIGEMTGKFGGWMADAFGWKGDWASTNIWTGSGQSQGPFYVCEFYLVTIRTEKLQLWSDNILRYESETVPDNGATLKFEDDKPIGREDQRRIVTKYVVTALDMIKKTPWYGDMVPHFWVMGPEIWIDGKLYRLSLIANAIDAQRGLNFSATSIAEILGRMTKSPIIGWEGQFDVTNAQGFNGWNASNTQMVPYLEVKPVFAIDRVTGASQLLPAPQPNLWEAPIVRVMEAANFFGEQIKAATAVFFEPSLLHAKDAQSGLAIKALQSQSNIGTLNWQDQTNRAIALSYEQARLVFKKIYSGERVRTIVRADSQTENATINKIFPSETHTLEPGGKYRHKQTGKLEATNNISDGDFGVRVTVGPSVKDRTDKSIQTLTEVFKIVPQLLQAPQVAARFLRMVGEGNPEVEAIADGLAPNSDQTSPDQLQAQLQSTQEQLKQVTGFAQQLHQAIQEKMPELEQKKWSDALKAFTSVRVAEITASKDTDNAKADNEASLLETLLGFAHDAATQATDHEHEQGMQESQQQAAAEGQHSDQDHNQQMAAQAASQNGTGQE